MRIASNRRISALGVLVAALIGLVGGAAVSGGASAAPAVADVPTLTAPLTGQFTDAAGGVGRATGNFNPTRFFTQDGELFAEGVADLTLVDSAGEQVGTATPTVTLPVSRPTAAPDGLAAQAPCQILDLVLGPLDLDLLGLVVHLDTVHLNITAESGPGNLVGNLLCAIAGLLDGPSLDLGVLADILNAILAIINA